MQTYLGIELGSTRIKAMLIDEIGLVLASGGFDWENRLENSIWTYSLDDVWIGLQRSFSELISGYEKKHGSKPIISGIGISGMMHGYLVLDKNDNQLTAFRTWRNTITAESANELSELFDFNIPQRWSIAHLHREIIRDEEHVKNIAYITTLAGYVHYKLTGNKSVGVCDASGMFPIDSSTASYNAEMINKFDKLISIKKLPWKLLDILPKVQIAGQDAGKLTANGAGLLDPSGFLQPGIPFCPPEGDSGTSMVATNSLNERTGNVSAGTSIFAMLVLEKQLTRRYPEIDMMTTPTGKPAAEIHCNNCTSELDAWVEIFRNVLSKMGINENKTALYKALYDAALDGEANCGGLVSVNYLSGEHITGFDEGRPIFLAAPDSSFSIENFMRCLLFSSVATLKIGIDKLRANEGVTIDAYFGHGGMFKTAVVAQKLFAGALGTPVAVTESAGEGGAWGIALLSAFSVNKSEKETLEDYLDNKIFADSSESVISPDAADVKGFAEYLIRYKSALKVERAAIENIQIGGSKWE